MDVFNFGMYFFIYGELRDIIKKSNLGDGLGGILGDSLGVETRPRFPFNRYS